MQIHFVSYEIAPRAIRYAQHTNAKVMLMTCGEKQVSSRGNPALGVDLITLLRIFYS